MPTEEMFWHMTTGERVEYNDKIDVPLVAYRCKAILTRTVDGVNRQTAHRCKIAVDHDGPEHICICGKRWANSRAASR